MAGLSKLPQLDLVPTSYPVKRGTHGSRVPGHPRSLAPVTPLPRWEALHPPLEPRLPPLGAAACVLIIKAPLCVSGEAGLGAAVRGAHKAPAAVCLQTGELSCAEGLKALIVFN